MLYTALAAMPTGDVIAGPRALGEVSILNTPLDAALGFVVELMPEAHSSFEDIADIPSVSSAGAGVFVHVRGATLTAVTTGE
jgi:predicted NodU family carbamoyl transferase